MKIEQHITILACRDYINFCLHIKSNLFVQIQMGKVVVISAIVSSTMQHNRQTTVTQAQKKLRRKRGCNLDHHLKV